MNAPTPAATVHRIFHETWLGECQPSEGLTFSVPALCDADVMQRLSAAQARTFETFVDTTEQDDDHRGVRLTDLRRFLLEFCGWTDDELHGPDRMSADLLLRLAEEGTELRPSFAIPYGNPRTRATEKSPLVAGEQTPASRTGAPYQP